MGMWPRLWQQLVRQSAFSKWKRSTSADTSFPSLISTTRSYAKRHPIPTPNRIQRLELWERLRARYEHVTFIANKPKLRQKDCP